MCMLLTRREREREKMRVFVLASLHWRERRSGEVAMMESLYRLARALHL